MKKLFTILIFSLTFVLGHSQTFSTFKVFNDMPQDTFWNGSDLSGGFIDGKIDFPCIYDTSYGGFWSSGWAISTVSDDTTAGAGNLYGIRTHSRIDDSPFAIGQNYSYFNVVNVENDGRVLFEGLYLTNTTYAYLSMKNGDAFAKKFGGDNGSDPDFFKLRIYGMQNGKIDSTNFVDFYLADFRFDNDSLDYIVDDWWYVDLSPLGYIDGLTFELSSSDVGAWGMNTPAFFAVDKIKYSYFPLNYIPRHKGSSFEEMNLLIDTFWNGSDLSGKFEDGPFSFECKYDTSYGGYWSGGFALSTMRDDITGNYTNLYSAIPGGAYDNITYAIVQNNSVFDLNEYSGVYIKNIKITNSTYAYYSMKYGDSFAKKFGGETGNDPDFFKLRIYGIPSINIVSREDIDSTNYMDIYLADFRFDNNEEDYIVDDWIKVDILDSLGYVKGLAFELTSSDNGAYGMNTPAFFALDAIEYDSISGINEQDNNMTIEIYPNPTSDYIKVDIDEQNTEFDYQIIDLSGKVIIKGIVKNEKMINLSGLNTGTYFIEVCNGQKRAVKNIIKI